jgi:hypothetical protein
VGPVLGVIASGATSNPNTLTQMVLNGSFGSTAVDSTAELEWLERVVLQPWGGASGRTEPTLALK